MPTPAKPVSVLEAEGKSHRTKAELEKRKEGEKALATGTQLKERPEVKNNEVAHKEFLRLNKLLKTIEKNDAIYEAVINRYCILHAECHEFEQRRSNFLHSIDELEADRIDVKARKEELIKYLRSLTNYLSLFQKIKEIPMCSNRLSTI